MKNFYNRGITAFETEILFRHVLNMEQVKNISRLLKTLGKYMVLDRDMLNVRAGQIGLSYIIKSVENGLIVEYEDQDKKRFLFNLGVGGIYFLESQGYFINKLKLDCDKYDRQRILTVNRYMIEKGYEISTEYQQRKQYDVFMARKKGEYKTIVLYYSYLITEEKVREQLKSFLGEGVEADVDDLYQLEELKIKQEEIGSLTEIRAVNMLFENANE